MKVFWKMALYECVISAASLNVAAVVISDIFLILKIADVAIVFAFAITILCLTKKHL